MPAPTRTRRSYHTDLKLAAYHGLLPDSLTARIPRSTLHDLRRSDHGHHFGLEYADFLDNVPVFKELAHHKTVLAVCKALLRLSHLIRSLGVPVDRIRNIKVPKLRQKIVAVVDRVKNSIPVAKALKFLNLSASRLAAWSKNLLCQNSPLKLCRQRHPQQLTVQEVRTIRRAFSDPQNRHWPMSSVSWNLIHNGRIAAHVQTITRYANILGLSNRHSPRKSRQRGSLTAVMPNQAWHCDATVITTRDHHKAYLQLVIDSFSRKILAWKPSEIVSGLSTTELLKAAFATLEQVPSQNIDLIVDGGSENNNRTVEGYLSTVPIRKLIAKVDVTFSNSLIEAVNKILKYQYLFRNPIPDLEHLEAAVREAIDDYNRRPHAALNGLTPEQAYSGMVFDRQAYHERILEASRNRRLVNSRACSPCLPIETTADEESK